MAVYLCNSFNYNKKLMEEIYDYDITKWLVELLNKKDNIKLDSEYVNDYYNITDATESNIEKWENDKLFKELKDDMESWCQSIVEQIRKLPGVESVTLYRSKSVGMSTYINVKFSRPDSSDPIVKRYLKDDPKFLTHYFSGFGEGGGYEGEYRLKFRVSNHDPKFTDANVLVNALNHNYSWIETKIIDVCKKRIDQLKTYWRDYVKTGKISPKQIKRNKLRKEKEVMVIENFKKRRKQRNLKETFGNDRLLSMLDDNTLEYINITHTNTEDIVDQIETYPPFEKYNYIKLLRVAADCLNRFIIEYTFEENSFDYITFLDDMKNKLNIYD